MEKTRNENYRERLRDPKLGEKSLEDSIKLKNFYYSLKYSGKNNLKERK